MGECRVGRGCDACMHAYMCVGKWLQASAQAWNAPNVHTLAMEDPTSFSVYMKSLRIFAAQIKNPQTLYTVLSLTLSLSLSRSRSRSHFLSCLRFLSLPPLSLAFSLYVRFLCTWEHGRAFTCLTSIRSGCMRKGTGTS